MKKHFLPTTKFNLTDAKMFVVAALLCFHILPMIFVFMGEGGQSVLMNMFMLVLNPMFIFGTAFFYGAKLGFEWKFPLILGMLAAASLFMYYSFPNPNDLMESGTVCAVVYMMFSYAFAFAGAVFKKLTGK